MFWTNRKGTEEERGRTKEKPRKNQGKTQEKPRKNPGKTKEKPRKDQGKTKEKPRKDQGKTKEKPGKRSKNRDSAWHSFADKPTRSIPFRSHTFQQCSANATFCPRCGTTCICSNCSLRLNRTKKNATKNLSVRSGQQWVNVSHSYI